MLILSQEELVKSIIQIGIHMTMSNCYIEEMRAVWYYLANLLAVIEAFDVLCVEPLILQKNQIGSQTVKNIFLDIKKWSPSIWNVIDIYNNHDTNTLLTSKDIKIVSFMWRIFV
ncbi:uncharacterized protein LOC116417127 [Nasonia vitripennis]|uniref:Uncharacterized protein n=1 Tax=Nasonia vitripennis TaxID=7425 RepID=A0A7M7QC80_NASVI|nr:uncharacterized protein LOC116417127 [Nasonia vitripennis]